MHSNEIQPPVDRVSDDLYDAVQGEVVPDYLPGSRSFPSSELIRNRTVFRRELKNPLIRSEVEKQHQAGKVVAASHRATEIILHIATRRNAVFAGGATLAGASAFYFFRNRKK